MGCIKYWVHGGVLQLGTSVDGSRASGKHAAERHSVLMHVAAHCNVLRQWMWQPKEGGKDKKEVVMCSLFGDGSYCAAMC